MLSVRSNHRAGSGQRRGHGSAASPPGPAGRPAPVVPAAAPAIRPSLARRLLDIMRSDAALGGADVATSVEIRQFEPGMYVTERDE